MQIERLEQYRGLKAEVKAIEKLIDDLYVPIASPNGNHSTSGPSNPTEKTALRIIALKERLRAKQEKMMNELSAIDSWLETVEDSEIRAIIREHYINGNSWNVTNFKVYKYYDYFYSRKRVMRYFGKEI